MHDVCIHMYATSDIIIMCLRPDGKKIFELRLVRHKRQWCRERESPIGKYKQHDYNPKGICTQPTVHHKEITTDTTSIQVVS